MNDDDRALLALRDEVAQAIEVDGRRLRKYIALLQWMISKRARGECPHIHAEDWPEIRASLDLPNRPGNMFGPPNWAAAWPRRKDCAWAGDDR